VAGKEHTVAAGTDSIIAGSPRARNLGAIAGSAAAGALIGKAVGGGKGALIGGILGGATATGVVAKSKGYQVVLKPGTELTFNVNHSVAMK
jgi:outer membrane lipoprotein SlyB